MTEGSEAVMFNELDYAEKCLIWVEKGNFSLLGEADR